MRPAVVATLRRVRRERAHRRKFSSIATYALALVDAREVIGRIEPYTRVGAGDTGRVVLAQFHARALGFEVPADVKVALRRMGRNYRRRMRCRGRA